VEVGSVNVGSVNVGSVEVDPMDVDPVDVDRVEIHRFETAIGVCAVVWKTSGLMGVHLTAGGPHENRRRMAQRFPDALESPLPGWLRPAVGAMVELLDGTVTGPIAESNRNVLAKVPLHLHGLPPFHCRVYQYIRSIPPGQVLTYGEVGDRLGAPKAARAVGQALRRNPFPLVVPCHRVVGVGGSLVGFSGGDGIDTKRRLLLGEGALLPLASLSPSGLGTEPGLGVGAAGSAATRSNGKAGSAARSTPVRGGAGPIVAVRGAEELGFLGRGE